MEDRLVKSQILTEVEIDAIRFDGINAIWQFYDFYGRRIVRCSNMI